MGQKVNPTSFRTGYIKDWKSKWFSNKNFGEYLEQDYKLRKLIHKRLKDAAISKVDIERSPRGITFSIFTPRPGIIIGRGGAGVDELKEILMKEVEKLFGKRLDVKVNIEEVKDPLANAAVIARGIAEQLEKRIPFRRAIKQSLDRSKDSMGVKGIKVMVSGRLNGAEMSRREWVAEGNIPLHTLRADIDFARDEAYTTYGVIGIKVWVYRGQIFKGSDSKEIKPEEKKTSKEAESRKPGSKNKK